MSDEVMNNLLTLLQNTVDGNRMSAEQMLEIIKGIGKGIEEDTKRMEMTVKRMQGVVQELAFLIGESMILVPESVLGISSGVERPEMKTEKGMGRMQPDKEETYPVAFFYRSKVPGTHGFEGFYLVIDETEDELVFYVYDQNQQLVNSGKIEDKSLPLTAIEEIAVNKEVLPYYSCYRLRPEVLEMRVNPPEKEQDVSAEKAESEAPAEKTAREDTEKVEDAEKHDRGKAI